MTFDIYQPVPVLLPEESGLRREFLTRESDGDDVPLSDAEYAQYYDSRTIFYDVFRREEDPRQVIAIGPPPVNLAPELRGLRITCAGRTLRHRLLGYSRRLMVTEITFDEEAASERELELDFAFPSFAARVRVPPCGERMAAPRPGSNGAGLHAAGPLAMMALQKDNEIEWIEDWCRWHCRLHDVTRFRIYDNGSANIELLEEALRRLGDEMDIVLVRWPYPYGPHRSWKNRFAQAAAMNHYRLRFGGRDAWCLLMDVDEYLATSGERSLREILAANEREGIVSVPMDSFMVPPHPEQGPAWERRVWRHVWRERHFRGFNEKYVCVPSRAVFNDVHRTWPGTRRFERCARWLGGGRALLRLCHEGIPKRIERLEQSRSRWSGVGIWLLRRLFPRMRRMMRHQSRDDLFFFHFRGLNTNWRPGLKEGEAVESFDAERHVEDTRMRTLAERAGLVPDGAGAVGQSS